MASLQELNARQISEALSAAAKKHVPAGIAVQVDNNWTCLPSRILAVTEKHMLIEMPLPSSQHAPHEFVPGEKVGLSFKLKHHKHSFTATVAALADLPLNDGTAVKVIALSMPIAMQRLQRRAYYRVDVPPNRIVRASFWLGGREAEPRGTSPTMPVWSGTVRNLSAGGFQFLAPAEATVDLEVGETVGARLVFGAARETVYADAQFRHSELHDDRALMGFQFLSLAYTPEGREALKLIIAKVGEFQQACPHFSEHE